MNTKNKLLLRAAFVAGMSACLAAPAAHARPNVPLAGALTYTSTLEATGTPACPYARMLVGTGTVSHLGKAAIVATDCLDPLPGSFAILNGNITLTAANGEKLYATYTGMLVNTGGVLSQGRVYEFSEVTYNITGGTGRFVGAKGTGKLGGSEDMAAHQGQITVVGTIAY